jgi:hypothetical protein
VVDNWNAYGGRPKPKLKRLILDSIKSYQITLLNISEDWALLVSELWINSMEEQNFVIVHACQCCDLGARFQLMFPLPAVCNKCNEDVPSKLINHIKFMLV